MRVPTARTFAVVATATVLLGGVTASAHAGDTGPSIARQTSSVIWCRQTNGLMRQVWTKSECRAGESKYVLKAGTGPVGPRGVPGATGAQGPTGTTGQAGSAGARGPSDLYPGTSIVQLVVGDTLSTFDTAAVPAGSYQVQFSAFVFNSTVDQNIVCAVQPSSGPALNLPVTHARILAGGLQETSISATGWYTAVASTTFALGCAVSGTGQTATLGDVSMTALQVATIH